MSNLGRFVSSLSPELAAEFRARMIESAVHAIGVIGVDGRFEFLNDAAAAITGYAAEELIGRPIEAVVAPGDLSRVQEAFASAGSSGSASAVTETGIVCKNGSIRRVEFRVAPLVMEGKVVAFVGTALDITESRMAEEKLRESEDLYRDLVERSQALICVHDLEGRIVAANEAAARNLGYDRDKDLATKVRNIRELLAPEAMAGFSAYLETIRTRGAASGVMAVRTRTGKERLWEYHNTLRTEGVETPVVRGIAFDVTERHRSELTLKQSEERFAKAFRASPLAISITRVSDQRYIDVNPAFLTLIGREREDVIGKTSLELGVWVDLSDRATLVERLRVERSVSNLSAKCRRPSGELRDAVISVEMIELNGEECGLSISQDVTERLEAERQVQYQAQHDALTGLPNRMVFRDRVGLAIAHARRAGDHAGVLFLDLDHFKLINDTLGHSTGDELLCEVARRLTRRIREVDTVARVGGDEFTLLLPSVRQEEDVSRIARDILHSLAEPFFLSGRELYVTGSVGIGLFPADGEDTETLIKHADNAMYRAKDLGRNNYQFYTPLMHRRALERVNLEGQLRHALERGEFRLLYQPQLELAGDSTVGAEALLRWAHPERGLLPPKEFIPVAEESGLIPSIGEWVLREACDQARRWGSGPGGKLRVAVNVSPRQFQMGTLREIVERTLRETGLDAALLDLEITESLAMQDPERTVPMLEELARMGVRISMDDFGTGYSSLASLRTLPIHRLKVDQSFVAGIGRDRGGTAIVKAIVTMGHSLGLAVVAEGVETEEQLEALREAACDEAQGFLISRPITGEDFSRSFLQAGRWAAVRSARPAR